LELIHHPLQHPALENLQHHLRSLLQNGGFEFARFQVADFSLQTWFATRTRQAEQHLVHDFLTNPTVIAACPALKIQSPLPIQPEIEPGSALTLDGELAQTLIRGGAYAQFPGTGAEAKAMGQQFCEMLFGNRYTDIQLYKTHTAWSEWFSDVAWDCTWIGLDLQDNCIWMLCITDTD
jgi:hypothetical protein